MALDNEEKSLLADVADETVDGSIFNSYNAGIDPNVQGTMDNLTLRVNEWVNVLKGVLARRLAEYRGGDYLSVIDTDDYEGIEEIAEDRRDAIEDSLTG